MLIRIQYTSDVLLVRSILSALEQPSTEFLETVAPELKEYIIHQP
jgi:hypothetical protein